MSTTPRKRSITKGLLAGLIGGLAGAGAKIIAEQIFPPRTQGQTPPPVLLAENVAGRRLPEQERELALQGIHWIFGALAGAVYGALVEMEPSLGAWRGAAFGITLNRITHESILPKLGLTAASRQPAHPGTHQRVGHPRRLRRRHRQRPPRRPPRPLAIDPNPPGTEPPPPRREFAERLRPPPPAASPRTEERQAFLLDTPLLSA